MGSDNEGTFGGGAATTAVARLVLAADAYPDFDPVTRTVMVLPRSAEPKVIVEAVAPEIAAPDLYH
ncbi:hypothetical protein JOF48_002815 [Arthrobacter stackebrandtii]|uniref:Uncharacterized protein n=1 Tax=Arthrobacter stackebrandtii TaxID=272161 RepID=A0ABS4YYY9_9MICC|nr:hypothetical protein [Arthrobacter stackebrandtii]MBP2414016.1 hypothetical protein [Arthrobacter stackebrandtii]